MLKHTPMDYGDLEPNTCPSDSMIVGGPQACSGPVVTMHVRYGVAPLECWDTPVCLAHLVHTLTFIASENGWSAETITDHIELTP